MDTANRGISEGLPDNELLCFGLASDMVSEQLGSIGISDNSSMRMLRSTMERLDAVASTSTSTSTYP